MPNVKPEPLVEFDMQSWIGLPKSMGRNASYLCQLEWAWSPVHMRLDAYYISRGRTHWILWKKFYDDNWDKWEDFPKARCARKKLGERDAAMLLLAGHLQ